LLALLFYVEKRPIALLTTTIIGAFAWQIVSICGALLLIFPRTGFPVEVITPETSTYTIYSVKISRIIKFGWIALLMLSIVGVVYLTQGEKDITIWTSPLFVSTLSNLITGLPSLVGVTIALFMLTGNGNVLFFKAVVTNLRKTPLILFVLAIMALFIPWVIVRGISSPSVPDPSGFMLVLRLLLFPPNGKFLLPLVALAALWGPIVLLLLLQWKEFCIEARKLGPGFVAVIGLNLPLGLVAESRFVTFAWPFFVLGAVLAMESRTKSTAFKFAFAVLTILYAQFWMKINLAPWTGSDYEHLFDFPKQVFFMHYGLWMNWWSYSLQLCVIVLSVLWLRSTMLPVKAKVV
jgi:hypothetical protein